MEYKIVWSPSVIQLEKDVKNHIKEGWIPIGGVSVSDGNSGKIWVQALIKNKYD